MTNTRDILAALGRCLHQGGQVFFSMTSQVLASSTFLDVPQALVRLVHQDVGTHDPVLGGDFILRHSTHSLVGTNEADGHAFFDLLEGGLHG